MENLIDHIDAKQTVYPISEEKRLELIANLQELIDLEKIKDTMTLEELVYYKVKSAAYNWQETPTSVINELQVQSHADEIMKAIDKTRKWITEDPLVLDNFICDLGAEGVCLGYFDGKSWFKLWTKEPIKVYGWINIPGIQLTSKRNELTTDLKELAIRASEVLIPEDFKAPFPQMLLRRGEGERPIVVPQAFLIEFARLIQENSK